LHNPYKVRADRLPAIWKILGMRRTLAVALAAGVLMIGGCARQHAAAPPPATDRPAAPAAAATKAATKAKVPAATSTSDDVDQLLNQVDKQISSDDQPSADQD
jgi:hypothetical protein